MQEKVNRLNYIFMLTLMFEIQIQWEPILQRFLSYVSIQTVTFVISKVYENKHANKVF